MIRIRLEDAVPDMELARPAITANEQVLLRDGAVLTPAYIERLKSFGLRRIWVRDQRLSDIVPLDLYTPGTRIRVAARLREVFAQLAANPKIVRSLGTGPIEHVISETRSDQHRLIILPDDGPSETPLLRHSVTVGLLANALGAMMHLGPEQLRHLAIGGLLHDIGHAGSPNALTAHPGVLDAQCPEHVSVGFQTIYRAWSISASVPAICAQHHECENGSGWPRALRSSQIQAHTKIVSVADVYDNMVADGRHMPHAAIEAIGAMAGEVLDSTCVAFLRSRMVPYPPGTPLVLSTGDQAVVIRVVPTAPGRPVVRLISDKGSPRDVPLAECPFIRIQAEAWRKPTMNPVRK